MLRGLRKKPPVSVLAHNQALHYLVNRPLTHDIRKQLIEVVLCHTGLCDEVAARAGIEWMRERYRERGERAPF